MDFKCMKNITTKLTKQDIHLQNHFWIFWGDK